MKQLINSWRGTVSISVLILAGCATETHIKKDSSLNFHSYKTFSWEEKQKTNSSRRNDLTEGAIKLAVDKELAKAGWQQVNRDPDIFLTYDNLVEKTIKENNDPVYTMPYSRLVYNPYSRRYVSLYYPSELLGYERYGQPVREGTITISMIDTRNDKMVWQGWTSNEVNSNNLTNREIENAVKAIFRKADLAKR